MAKKKSKKKVKAKTLKQLANRLIQQRTKELTYKVIPSTYKSNIYGPVTKQQVRKQFIASQNWSEKEAKERIRKYMQKTKTTKAEAYKAISKSIGKRTEAQTAAIYRNLKNSMIAGVNRFFNFYDEKMSKLARPAMPLDTDKVFIELINQGGSGYATDTNGKTADASGSVKVAYAMWKVGLLSITPYKHTYTFKLRKDDIRFDSPKYVEYRQFMVNKGWTQEEAESYGS